MKLSEGVYDPGILKAIFMGGGPGSGKSFVSREVLGIPKKISFSAMGIKFLDSDVLFEKFLKSAGYGTKLDSLSDKEFQAVTDPNPESGSPRARAKTLVTKQMDILTKARLGILVDGTGRDVNRIVGQRNKLIAMGYDCSMVFINTTLEKALERNTKRARSLPADIVAKAWHDAQKNISTYSHMFGGRMVAVDNSADLDSSGNLQIPNSVYKIVDRFVAEPIRNPKGRRWVERELELKRQK